MKFFIFSLFFSFCSYLSVAQNAEEKAILETIDKLFIGLEKTDTTGFYTIFYPLARLQTIGYKTEKPVLTEDDIKIFFQSIATPKKVTVKEELLSKKVQIDADLATVWTPYKFYINGQLSHCGANAFTLVKVNNKWQILHIIDTRRKNCE
jgi:hypothetical protein